MSLQTDLAKKNEEIAAKQAALSELFKGVTDLSGQPAHDRRDAIKSANDELTALATQRDETADLVKIEDDNKAAMKAMRQPTGRQAERENDDAPQKAAVKTLADLLAENVGYQESIKSGRQFIGELGALSLKTLMTSADISDQATRLPPVSYATEDRTTADMMLQGRMNSPVVEYYEETTFTNSAAEATEGTGSKGEGALDFTLVQETAAVIAVWIPVTTQLMSDSQGFEDYLRGRLGFMVKQREELQILVGNGTPPNIKGIHNRTGVQTQAKGADPVPDAIYKGITKVRNTGFAEPTGVVFHPNDWQDVRLLRTADGIYIWGNPSDAGPERIWGLEVRITTNETENTALVGAFRPYSQLWRRQDIQLAVSDSHSDYFILNKLAVRAEERVALAVYRGAAFCKVTGI